MTWQKVNYLVGIALLLFIVAIVWATPDDIRLYDDYPSVDALEKAIIPIADRADIARRFNGVTDVPAPPTSAPLRTVGEVDTFNVFNLNLNEAVETPVELVAISDHAYIWVDVGLGTSQTNAQEFADRFDVEVYDTVREAFGSEPLPGIDGDERVYIVFSRSVGGGAGAYFTGTNLYSALVVPDSNEHEMVIFNWNAFSLSTDMNTLLSVAAHEFQHMIRFNISNNTPTWLDEGFSTFVQYYLGYGGDIGSMASFMNQPQTQLNFWDPFQVFAHYGAGGLLVSYLYERYGLEGIQAVSQAEGSGLAIIDDVVKQFEPDSNVDEFFADWVVANWAQADSGIYSYSADYWQTATLLRVNTQYDASALPFTATIDAQQYGTTYTQLPIDRDLTITLEMPEETVMYSADASSGDWVFYSNYGDHSNTRLTQEFDLSGVDTATLTYDLWYDIEDEWDFGYVSISADDGQTWEFLETALMTRENGTGNNLGIGYSGQSDGWVTENISLADYTGQVVQVRWEILTDDALVMTGMVIDNVEIVKIGYRDDFEVSNDSWEAEGWVRIDNRIPQNAWVQIIERLSNGEINVIRYHTAEGNAWDYVPSADAIEAVLAISPIAPFTFEPVQYQVRINS